MENRKQQSPTIYKEISHPTWVQVVKGLTNLNPKILYPVYKTKFKEEHLLYINNKGWYPASLFRFTPFIFS